MRLAVGLQLFFDGLVQAGLIFINPGGQYFLNNLPGAVTFFLHFKNKAVAAVVAHVHMKKIVGGTGQLSEIKFP